jgi:TolA-binding protein
MSAIRILKLFFFAFTLQFSFNSFSRDEKSRVAVSVQEEKKEKHDFKKEAKPRNSHIKLENKLEKKLIHTIDATVGFLENTSKNIPKNSTAYFEILFRIMTLRMEQAIYAQNNEFDNFEIEWERWDKNGRKNFEPKSSSDKSTGIWKKVVKLGREISEKFSENEHGDKVLFNLAYAYQYLNKDSHSIASFEQLVKKYPKSTLVSEAHFSLGDYSFDRSDFHSAIAHYTENLKDPRSSQYGWALFKLGWSYYNMGQFQTAIDFWKKTIAYTNTIDETKGKRIRSEVFKDMPYAYAELDQLNEAIAFYKSTNGEKYLSDLYKTMASIYFNYGKLDRSIFLWKKLIEVNPSSPEAASYQMEVISIEYEKREYQNILNENILLMKNYGPNGPWAKINSDNDSTVYKKSFYYCKLIHKEAQSNNDKNRYDLSRSCYDEFLQTYPNDKRMAEIMEYIGDIEYYLTNYSKAGHAYAKVASKEKEAAILYGEGADKVGNNHERCASNMLDAYNKNYSIEFSQLVKRHVDENTPSIPLSEAATLFMRGCSVYQRFYPEDKKAIKNCDLITSEIYHRSAIRSEAKNKLYEIAVKYSAEKEGVIAAENLLPYYKLEKNKLLEVAYALQKIPEYKTGAFGLKLNALVRAAEVDLIVATPSGIDRAKLYEDRAKKYPKDPDADKYLFNAAADYLAYGTISQAIRIYVLILSSYPTSSVFEESLLQLGKLQESVLEFENAAHSYQQYAEKYSAKKESKGAYRKACELQMAIDSNQAISVCSSFISRFPMDEKDILHALIVSKIRSGKKSEAINLLVNKYKKHLTSNNEKIFYYYSLYQLQGTASSIDALLALPQKKEELDNQAILHYGEVLFQHAVSIVSKIQEYQLKGGSVETLQVGIQQLSEYVAQAESLFGRVLALQDPYWGVAAFYELGLCYELFEIALENPPEIDGANPTDVKAQLQSSIDELRVKSMEYYKAGYDTSEKYSIYSEYSVLLLNRHNKTEKKQKIEWWFDDALFLGFYTNNAKIQNKIGALRVD